MSNVVQLEAFESSLKHRRIRWFLPPGHGTTYPPGFQEQCFTESPPFQRRILLTARQSSEAWKLTDKWDAVLQPQTPTDWSLALTVLLNQPPPTLVICTPECVIPAAVFQKCLQAGQKAPTFVWFQILQLPIPQAPIQFDATFFPPAKAVEDSLIEAIETVLPSLISGHQLQHFVVKDALRDLRGAGATIVVSQIEDVQPTLYWYYASESPKHQSDLLSCVVQTLLSRDKM
jgi:hypothetical protein